MFPFDFGTTESGDSQAPQQGDVMRNIGAFMGDPRVQGALLSSGLALMQPPSYGDNFVSQLGRAIGAAGESAQSQQKQDIAQSESESKQDLRGAQADAAAARSQTAAAQLAQRQAESQAKVDAAEAKKQNDALKAHNALQIGYNNAINSIRKINEERRLFKQPELPEPSFQEYVESNPQLRALYGSPDVFDTQGGVKPTPAPPYNPNVTPKPNTGGGPTVQPQPVPRPTPSQAAIQALLKDPNKAQEFDAYYGPGSAAKYLPKK